MKSLRRRKTKRKMRGRKNTMQTHLVTASAGVICDHPNCTFTASNRAGLVNHKRQIHGPRTTAQCDHCGKYFNTQRLQNHKRSVPIGTDGLGTFLACITPPSLRLVGVQTAEEEKVCVCVCMCVCVCVYIRRYLCMSIHNL